MWRFLNGNDEHGKEGYHGGSRSEQTLDSYGTASTSEWLTLCLALDRHDQLVGTGYDTPAEAWARLDDRQRAIVWSANPSFEPSGS